MARRQESLQKRVQIFHASAGGKKNGSAAQDKKENFLLNKKIKFLCKQLANVKKFCYNSSKIKGNCERQHTGE